MRAAVAERYGTDALELKEIETPALPDDRILVRVRAASLNKLDWYGVTGTPLAARVMTGLRRPKSRLVGNDFAGIVEAVGKDIHGFSARRRGVRREQRSARGDRPHDGRRVAPKPANLTFEEAAAVPIAALTALQGLRDHGQVQPGQHVLVHGASGGVGTFAVQIAKALGAEVTAVCSTRNVEQARALGADHVVDYTKEDVSRSGRRFDVIMHVGGRLSWRRCKRLLTPEGRLILAGATGNSFLGPLGYFARMWLASQASRRKAVFFIAKFNRPDLDVIRELLESGQIRPVVEKRYELSRGRRGSALPRGRARARQDRDQRLTLTPPRRRAPGSAGRRAAAAKSSSSAACCLNLGQAATDSASGSSAASPWPRHASMHAML